MNMLKKKFQFIKLSDVLNLLGEEFHLYEQPASVCYSKMYTKEGNERGTQYKRIYAQHITKLDINEISYYKDLWFQMYIYTKQKQNYTIYDDNVSFSNEDISNMKVSSNPYISPMFVMRDSTSYMNKKEKKFSEMIKMNKKFLNWLNYMGINDEDLEKYYIHYEYDAEYKYNLPDIELDYNSHEFKGYKDGCITLSTYEIDEIIKSIKSTYLKTKTEYILKNLGNCNNYKEREVYDYD